MVLERVIFCHLHIWFVHWTCTYIQTQCNQECVWNTCMLVIKWVHVRYVTARMTYLWEPGGTSTTIILPRLAESWFPFFSHIRCSPCELLDFQRYCLLLFPGTSAAPWMPNSSAKQTLKIYGYYQNSHEVGRIWEEAAVSLWSACLSMAEVLLLCCFAPAKRFMKTILNFSRAAVWSEGFSGM